MCLQYFYLIFLLKAFVRFKPEHISKGFAVLTNVLARVTSVLSFESVRKCTQGVGVNTMTTEQLCQ